MEDLELPAELQRLQRLLACGPQPEPSAALRRRVLRGVRTGLCRQRVLPKWRFAAAFAATLLVGLSLSFGVLQATVSAMQQHERPPSVDEVAKRLQQLSPALSREESLRLAALRQISVQYGHETPLGEIPSGPEYHDP